MADKNTILSKLNQFSDVILALGVVTIVIMMIIPMPPFLLDLLLALNITLSLTIVMISIYNVEPLQFSVFPSLLLVTTLFRLALNVSSTRLILLYGYAGEVIMAFGTFVVGGNAVVGFIVFIILILIQFIVITRGAERVAEVAARFTLDAMPGKQMAIDADLNAGLISDADARIRRRNVQREADFYGAMDGACKFVSGDVNAGMFITLVNIVGGIIIGMVQKDMDWNTALTTYSLLTIGDGLVSTIPSIIVSTGTGLLVSRAASEAKMGEEFLAQLTFNSRALRMVSAVLLLFALVPGLPTVPFLVISALIFTVARLTDKNEADDQAREKKERRPRPVPALPTPPKKCRPSCRWTRWSLKWATASFLWWTRSRAATCWRVYAPSVGSSPWTWAWSSPRCTCATTCSSNLASIPCSSRAIRWLRRKSSLTTFWPWTPAT